MAQQDQTAHLGPEEGPDPNFGDPTMRGLGHGPTAPLKPSQPPGLWVLFITEMWERFSYYGMRALLVLYLITSTSRENAGFGWTEDSAYLLYGLYTWAVYLTPIFGGLLADRLLGTHRSMLIGGWIIAAGHIALATTEFFGITAGQVVTLQANPGAILAFMTGLVLIVIGTGFFKPCVSVMVGQLYEENDPRRDSGFTVFYMGINLGAFICPFVAGTLGEKVGWHWGFGSTAVGMIAGLMCYKYFRPRYLDGVGLPPKQQAEWDAAHGIVHSRDGEVVDDAKPLSRVEWQRLAVIVILAFIGNIAFWTAFEQAGSSLNVFAARSTDRTVWGLLADDETVTQTVSLASGLEAGSFAVGFGADRTSDIDVGRTTIGELAASLGRLPAFGAGTVEYEGALEADAPLAGGVAVDFRLPHVAGWDEQPLLRVLPPGAAGVVDASSDVEVFPGSETGFPATWYQSVNPLAILLFAPFFAWLWLFLDRQRLNPSTPVKFAIGLFLMGLAFIFMVFGSLQSRDGGLAAPHWLLLTYMTCTWGELCLSPVGLSMVTKLAPLRLQSLMMGLWFFSFSLANLFAGLVARFSTKVAAGETTFFIEGLPGFFLFLVAMPIATGVVILILTPVLKRMMHGVK